jgi:hypothetical protein
MPAFPEELGKVLEEAGVPPGAARLFLLAWHEGPLTARQIARRAGIHRVQAYRQLKTLAARGLVSAGGHPLRFETRSLPAVLRRWMDELDRQARDLERERQRWRSRGGREGSPLPTRGPAEAWIEGRSEIRRFFFRLVRGARSTLDVGFPPLAALAVELRGERTGLVRAMARGVTIRLLVTDMEGPSRLAGGLAGIPGLALRRVGTRSRGNPFVLADGEWLLLAVLQPPWIPHEHRQASLWTRSRALVRDYQARFDLLFRQGTEVDPGRDPEAARGVDAPP